VVAVPSVVVDTNVFVSAIRSRRGASFRLVSEIGRGRFEIVVSVPLLIEYEAAMLDRRPASVSVEDVNVVLDYVAQAARHQAVFYLWRPLLRDAKDDLVLEVAVAGGCEAIVTYNTPDFAGAESFGILVMTPFAFLRRIGILT
jgi:putative PIN family toxin of toxin-antitoxin system